MAGRAEDNALGKMDREAEARRATRHQVRDEARAIRSREIERQRREEEEADSDAGSACSSVRAPSASARPFGGSRRSSAQSLTATEAGEAPRTSATELRQQVVQLEERYKDAMIANAQLDNEKQSLRYEVYLLKDKLEDMEEENSELHRLAAERKREISYQRLQLEEAKHQGDFLQRQIAARDQLIASAGLVLVGEAPEVTENGGLVGGMATVRPELARRLEALPEGPLESRLISLFEAHDSLAAEVQRLEQRLADERQRAESMLRTDSRRAPADSQVVEFQREASRQINEQKFKLQQAQQKVTALEGDIIRLEGQVKRYKTIADTCERQEEELKAEKRKLQRDLRDAHNRIEDLKTDNNSLSRKLEKLSRGAAGSLQMATKTHNLHSNA